MTLTKPKPFLTAQWKHLAMVNFEVDPAIVAPHVPSGVELDFFGGRTFVSVVGFMFLDTKVRGCRIPFHVNFPEVNLRFYVVREVAGEPRRGVTFIKEIVPRRAVSQVARRIYHENYVTYRMQSVQPTANQDGPVAATYRWYAQDRWHEVTSSGKGSLQPVAENSEEQFITEHFWGYSAQPDGGTVEYEVQHPSWDIYPNASGKLDCDVAKIYGPEFVEPLSQSPSSAFLVAGSDVTVYQGRRL